MSMNVNGSPWRLLLGAAPGLRRVPLPETGVPTDADLVRAARRGETAALGLLIARHRAAMLAVATGVLRHRPDAEDAVQEAVVVALLRIDSLRDPSAAGAWLRTVARDGDRIVAGANLYLHGTVASLNSGGTLPTHRRRGAQSALISARLKAARAAGATWVVGEAGVPAGARSNPSLDNQLRAGLVVRYHRQNWLWTAVPDTPSSSSASSTWIIQRPPLRRGR